MQLALSLAATLLLSLASAAPAANPPLNQIDDGQIQASTATTAAKPEKTESVVPVTEIGDGQPQAPVYTPPVETHPSPAPPPPATTATETHPIYTTSVEISHPAPSVSTVYSTDVVTVTTCSTSAIETHPPATTSIETHSAPPPTTSTKVHYSNTTISTQPTPTPSSICPLNLPPDFQYPHSITSDGNPSSYIADITPTTPVSFTFDIPPSYAGLTCSLVFALPEHGTMETSEYSVTGHGELSFDVGPKHLGNFAVEEGAKFVVKKPCPAGDRVTVDVSSVGGVGVRFFEDYNPCPVGLFVVPE